MDSVRAKSLKASAWRLHRLEMASCENDLYVAEQGSGRALLLLQGLGYASWAWADQLESFSSRWHTLAVDNRGSGRSVALGGPSSIEQMADDAAQVLVSRDVAPAHVLGLSMGGYIAQTTCSCPERATEFPRVTSPMVTQERAPRPPADE